MKKKEEEEHKKQAVPVIKQLARPMSKKELATVSGAHTTGTVYRPHPDADFEP
jgi:hypothetical protein